MFKTKPANCFETATNATIIAAGTTITGNLQCNGDIRIDGILHGNLEGKAKVIVGAQGLIEGDIIGKQADVMGAVNGILKIADLLCLHPKCKVNGDIFAGQLQIDPSASFNGQCKMSASVVGINAGGEKSIMASE